MASSSRQSEEWLLHSFIHATDFCFSTFQIKFLVEVLTAALNNLSDNVYLQVFIFMTLILRSLSLTLHVI